MKKIIVILFLILGCLVSFSACDMSESDDERGGSHIHNFGEWQITKKPTCEDAGEEERNCSCGDVKTRVIAALGHTVVIDAAVPPTCASTGLTEGTHCSDCNAIITAQATIDKLEHNYSTESIITNATCIQSGTKKLICDNCSEYIIEDYELTKYSATEINTQALAYVGEIITYDKQNNEVAVATGFVYSEDGKIITNFHVVDGAYSAKITINDTTYNIAQVLAYDENIDLAVLKVNSKFEKYANICKNEVAVGSTVYALGSSRGLTSTFSQGIVTYFNRVVDNVSHIQHDASITHGNSGGPLINEYGEVIGINTWGVNDSQNLNFAVFASEIDNLSFGESLTMAEFYQKESNKFVKIAEHIKNNGSYDYDSSYYYYVLGTSYSNDYSYSYKRILYYYPEDNIITFDLSVNSASYYVYFTIDENMDGSYAWKYFDDDDYEMSGVLYASTYDDDTLLGYDYNNISSSELRKSVRSLASSMVSLMCAYITVDLSDISITAADLHFYNYD